MLQNFKKLTAVAIAAACAMTSTVVAQETAQIAAQPTAATATLSADGQLTGNVITANANQVTQVPNAKVSLVSQGKVIDSVTADASGNFSFANVHPGPYQIVGTAAGMLGSNALTVAPFAKSQPTTPSRVVLQPSAPAPQAMYESISSAPVSSFTTSTGYATSTGGGFGGGIGSRLGGGRIGGRLFGRGLLSSPRGLLVVGGVAGGIAAIADSSPDE